MPVTLDKAPRPFVVLVQGDTVVTALPEPTTYAATEALSARVAPPVTLQNVDAIDRFDAWTRVAGYLGSSVSLTKTRAPYLVLVDLTNMWAPGNPIGVLSVERIARNDTDRRTQIEAAQAEHARSKSTGYLELYAVSAGHAAYLARQIMSTVPRSLEDAQRFLNAVKV